jgi:hypothetical protein
MRRLSPGACAAASLATLTALTAAAALVAPAPTAGQTGGTPAPTPGPTATPTPTPAPPAAPRAIVVTRPPAGAPIAVHPYVDGLAGEVVLRGRAARRTALTLTARCALGPCAAATVAGRRGRWRARLHVILPSGQRRLRVRVRYAVAPAPGPSGLLSAPLAPPAWALQPPYSSSTAAPALALLGDSLAVGTEAPLRAALPGWRVTSDGRVGRPLGEGMALLAATPLPRRPLALGFSLFTNDDPTRVEDLDAAVRASAGRLAPGGCALWATIARPRVGGVSYAAANRRLEELAAAPELAGRLVVVPWAGEVRGHPEWLREDRVHPTPEGYAARAGLYARAAEECRARGGW